MDDSFWVRLRRLRLNAIEAAVVAALGVAFLVGLPRRDALFLIGALTAWILVRRAPLRWPEVLLVTVLVLSAVAGIAALVEHREALR